MLTIVNGLDVLQVCAAFVVCFMCSYLIVLVWLLLCCFNECFLAVACGCYCVFGVIDIVLFVFCLWLCMSPLGLAVMLLCVGGSVLVVLLAWLVSVECAFVLV